MYQINTYQSTDTGEFKLNPYSKEFPVKDKQEAINKARKMMQNVVLVHEYREDLVTTNEDGDLFTVTVNGEVVWYARIVVAETITRPKTKWTEIPEYKDALREAADELQAIVDTIDAQGYQENFFSENLMAREPIQRAHGLVAQITSHQDAIEMTKRLDVILDGADWPSGALKAVLTGVIRDLRGQLKYLVVWDE